MQVIKEDINYEVEIIQEAIKVMKEDVQVVKRKTEMLEVQVGSITADVVKFDDVIELQKKHNRAINNVGAGIDRMMAHLHLM